VLWNQCWEAKMMKNYVGFFGEYGFKVRKVKELQDILTYFKGDFGEVYRVESAQEADQLYKQIYLCRYAMRDGVGLRGNLRFIEGDMFVQFNEEQRINISCKRDDQDFMFLRRPDACDGLSAFSWNVLTMQSAGYWSGIADNGYVVLDTVDTVQQFLTDEKVVYPAAYFNYFKEKAQKMCKMRYAYRYYAIFTRYPIEELKNYPVNQLYIDPCYESFIKKNQPNESWNRLLQHGIYQPY
jgi:hypothetical protein